MVYVVILILLANYGAWKGYTITESAWMAEFMVYFSKSLIVAGIILVLLILNYVYPKVV